MTAALEVTDLTGGYAGIPAVRGVTLDVRKGEIVAILGPNGAGKSTTLLTMAGVLRPISGTVTALGQPIRGGKPHLAYRRGIVLVPDNRAIIYSLTVKENLALAMRGRNRRDGVGVVVDLFPALKPKLTTRSGLLSGGEQQMLAVGRAVACKARVLLIDEMSMGLAPVIARTITAALRRAADELETAIVLVEQHVDLALKAADRAYVLSHGKVTLSGSAAEFRGRRELLQASYLGEVAAPADTSDRDRQQVER
jgi:branched-chain amino acid transport system ATP-binding protein